MTILYTLWKNNNDGVKIVMIKFAFKFSLIVSLSFSSLNAKEFSLEEFHEFANQTYIHKYKKPSYIIKVRYLHEARSFNVKGFAAGNLLNLTSKGLASFWRDTKTLFWSDEPMKHLLAPEDENKDYEKEFAVFFKHL